MQECIKNFVRMAPGVWECVKPVELVVLQGRIQVAPRTRLTVGTSFMGVDLAQLLEEQRDRIGMARSLSGPIGGTALSP